MAEQTTYDVVLLVEQRLSALDARQVRSLHEEISEPVRYHLLLPVEDAASRVETAMGSLAAGDMLGSAAPSFDAQDVADIQQDILKRAREDVDSSIARLQEAGAVATGRAVAAAPVDALADAVKEVGAAEAIILTRPHLVAEFFHVDWTSRARRKLGVPVLHLLEHETFDEQAGPGEGVTGF
jgi:hypothetical protein